MFCNKSFKLKHSKNIEELAMNTNEDQSILTKVIINTETNMYSFYHLLTNNVPIIVLAQLSMNDDVLTRVFPQLINPTDFSSCRVLINVL